MGCGTYSTLRAMRRATIREMAKSGINTSFTWIMRFRHAKERAADVERVRKTVREDLKPIWEARMKTATGTTIASYFPKLLLIALLKSLSN